MMQLQKEELKKYVNTVLALETQKRTLEMVQDDLESRKRQLETTTSVRPPVRREPEVSANQNGYAAAVLFCVILACVAVGFFLKGLVTLQFGTTILGIALGILGIAGATWFGMVLPAADAKEEWEKAQFAVEKEYERKYNRYLQEYQDEQRRFSLEVKKIEPDLETVREMSMRVSSALKEFYSLDIIYHSYRNIVPVASFCHYLNTGICDRLEGPDGCYRLYENEALQKLILTKLDVIINKLDELNERQYELKMALLESNESIKDLTSYVRGIGDENRQHHAITQYNQQCLMEETKYHNQYEVLRDILKK